MAFIALSYMGMASKVLLYTVMAYIVRSCRVMAYAVMACIFTAYMVTACTVMAYIVMACTATAYIVGPSPSWDHCLPSADPRVSVSVHTPIVPGGRAGGRRARMPLCMCNLLGTQRQGVSFNAARKTLRVLAHCPSFITASVSRLISFSPPISPCSLSYISCLPHKQRQHVASYILIGVS